MSEPGYIFPIADVLSVTTGCLLSHDHIDGVYRILNYLTGDSLMTHQLGRAARLCRPQVIAQHAWLADIQVPAGLDQADLYGWLATVEAEHSELELTPVTGWLPGTGLAEALAMFGANRVIPVVVDDV